MKPNMLQAILSHALVASCAQPWGHVQPATTQQHPASSLAHKLGVSVDELPERKANGNLQSWKGRFLWTRSRWLSLTRTC